MRIIHLADTHLGFRQFSGKLEPERRLNQRECDVYGVWHRAIVHEPGDALFVTAGLGTEHKPLR